jgi:hypothetical protein
MSTDFAALRSVAIGTKRLGGMSAYLSAFGSEADMGRRILPVISAAL